MHLPPIQMSKMALHLCRMNTKTVKDLPYKNRGNLIDGPIDALLIKLTVPMTWGIFAIIGVQLANTYFIGLLGTAELAGMSFTFPVTMTISHLMFGLNVAISSVVSRLIGQGQMDDARRVTLHALILGVLASALLSFVCFMFLQTIFGWMGADAQSMAVIEAFMPLWLAASVILAIPVCSNSALRASGEAVMPALIMTSIAAVNIVLDPLLIFGLFGFPKLGVAGAGWATIIANIAAAGFALYVMTARRKLILWNEWHMEQFSDSIKRLAMIAIPAGITNTIQPLTTAIITAILAGYGTEVVAAFGVATRVEAFAMLVIIALAVGMAPIIGQNWGAGNFKRVEDTIFLAIRFNFIWSFSVAAVLAIFAMPIAGLFSQDALVQHNIALFFWIVPISYAFGNLVFGWGSAFNAIGQPKRAFMMIAVKTLGMTVPFVMLGSWALGVVGIFAAIALANLASGGLFHVSCKKALRAQETSVAGVLTPTA